MTETKSSRHIGKSVAAVVAGSLVTIALSLGTDEILHLSGVYPPWGQFTPDGLLVLATVYRIVFTIAGAYVTARLAPANPMRHSLIFGAIGFILSVAGAAATWNLGVAGHWYSITIAAIALPCAWLGAKFWLRQSSERSVLNSNKSDYPTRPDTDSTKVAL